MKRVIIESPYAGEVEANIEYARKCLRHSILCGEAPFVSHLLYTQDGVLSDDIPQERSAGMLAGHAWYKGADLCAVYVDRGVSTGMKEGIMEAVSLRVPIHFRSINGRAYS